jgi:hypothetical protein
MSRRPWGIKPSEVRRAVNAILQTGLGVVEVKFGKDGAFSVIPGKGEPKLGEANNSGDPPLDMTPEDLREQI